MVGHGGRQLQAEQFLDLGGDLRPLQVAVALFPGRGEQVADGRLHAQHRIRGEAQRQGHPVGREKADSVDVAGQPVGVLPHQGDGPVAVLLEDAYREQGGDTVFLEKEHDLAHRPVLLPGGADGGQLAIGNARNLGELVHVLLEHPQGALAEVADDAPGDLRPHPADQAGAQVLLQRAGARGFQFGGIPGLELATEFRVLHPGTDKLHGGTGKDPRLMHGNRCQPVVCA